MELGKPIPLLVWTGP